MYTKQRVFKGYSVKIAGPLMLDPCSEAFEYLYNKIPTISKISQVMNQNDTAFDKSDDNKSEHLGVEALNNELEELNVKIAQAEQILIDAENKAKEIIQKATEDAVEIKRLAEQEIEEFKSEVAEATRQETFLKAQGDAQEILHNAQNVLLMATKVLENEYAQVDRRLMQLAILIAEKVIKASLKVKPDYLLNIINSITSMPQEKEDLCLQISPDDAAWISKQEFETYLPCSWIVNNSLRQGDVYLEHKKGFYNAQIQTQLANIEQKLWEELAREQMGQAEEQAS